MEPVITLIPSPPPEVMPQHRTQLLLHVHPPCSLIKCFKTDTRVIASKTKRSDARPGSANTNTNTWEPSPRWWWWQQGMDGEEIKTAHLENVSNASTRKILIFSQVGHSQTGLRGIISLTFSYNHLGPSFLLKTSLNKKAQFCLLLA